MSEYTARIQKLRYDVEARDNSAKQAESIKQNILDLEKQYVTMLEAQQLLSTVSEENSNKVLSYITSVINRALAELFPHDTRRIFLEKKLHNGQYPHINVVLETAEGRQRDLTLQSGTGLRQVISFLFTLSLIEIRKGRRILIMDELLSGLHKEAKAVVKRIMEIFAEEGFQFIMVEYGIDDLGKIYLVEKPNTEATVTCLEGQEYNNEVFIFNRPLEADTEEADTVLA